MISTLLAAGLDQALLDRAEAVIVFGSTAAGLCDASSDLDVLLVGEGRSLRTGGLDVVVVSEELARTWLPGSELGAHVRRWGKVLRGALAHGSVDPGTVLHKERLILSSLRALDAHGAWLSVSDLHRAQVRLRRHIQRWALLQQGEGPAPRPLLDARWRDGDRPVRAWRSLAQRLPRLTGVGRLPDLLDVLP